MIKSNYIRFNISMQLNWVERSLDKAKDIGSIPILLIMWKGGRVVNCVCLENRGLKRLVGSNLTPSFLILKCGVDLGLVARLIPWIMQVRLLPPLKIKFAIVVEKVDTLDLKSNGRMLYEFKSHQWYIGKNGDNYNVARDIIKFYNINISSLWH